MKKLAELGYRQVEGFGGVYDDPGAVRAVMDARGLIMPSGHFDIGSLENEFGKVEAVANALGIAKIVCPFLSPDDRPASPAGWRDVAGRLAAIGKAVAASGRTFAWHNHDFEFRKTSDGRVPMQILLEEAPAIEWEADLAWIVRGGEDPLAWIERYGDRITAVHVKDIAAAGDCMDEDGWADVGHGTMRWKQLIDALRSRSNCGLFIVEHDNPGDPDRFAGRSIEAMRQFMEPADV